MAGQSTIRLITDREDSGELSQSDPPGHSFQQPGLDPMTSNELVFGRPRRGKVHDTAYVQQRSAPLANSTRCPRTHPPRENGPHIAFSQSFNPAPSSIDMTTSFRAQNLQEKSTGASVSRLTTSFDDMSIQDTRRQSVEDVSSNKMSHLGSSGQRYSGHR